MRLALAPLLVVLAAGCARGCGEARTATAPEAPGASGAASRSAPAPTAMPAPATTTRRATHADETLPDRVERLLGLALPRRLVDRTFTGLATYPHRTLRAFAPERHLVARLDTRSLRVLDLTLRGGELDADERVRRTLEAAAERWERRSGVAANRLYLAIDRKVGPVLAARVRRLALGAGSWRVVALARQRGRLLELLLSPASAQRPRGVP